MAFMNYISMYLQNLICPCADVKQIEMDPEHLEDFNSCIVMYFE